MPTQDCVGRNRGDVVMISRRTVISEGTLAGLAALLAKPAFAEDLILPRQKVELVAPPFVHPHEQATTQGPKIMEFRLVTEEKENMLDDAERRARWLDFNGPL